MNGAFWALKLLSTAMGEATSDFLVHRFIPQLAVLAGLVVFAAALWAQLRATRYSAVRYWFTVAMVSVFGTMCADVVHVALRVPYVVSAVTFAVVLVLLFATWYAVEGTISIHTIRTTRRELFYWAAVTVTFAFGTALGDLTASTLGLGYFTSVLLFAALLGAVALTRRASRHDVLTFWTAYVLTRPLGASVADWCGVSPARGGLNWGPGTVGLSLAVAMALGVVAAALREASRRPLTSVG
ncbi:MAG: hypothetical protein ACP5PB_07415 [Acidimicrobiales bacterium]